MRVCVCVSCAKQWNNEINHTSLAVVRCTHTNTPPHFSPFKHLRIHAHKHTDKCTAYTRTHPHRKSKQKRNTRRTNTASSIWLKPIKANKNSTQHIHAICVIFIFFFDLILFCLFVGAFWLIDLTRKKHGIRNRTNSTATNFVQCKCICEWEKWCSWYHKINIKKAQLP